MAASLVLFCAAPAAAQNHHQHAGGADGPETAGVAGVSVELGRVDAFGAVRDYQGVAVWAAARLRRFELATHVPLYRIELGDGSHAGLGDLHLQAGFIALEGPIEAGVTLGAMPPLGSDEHGLAMGHWMLMGGGFARATRGRATGQLSLGYGSRIGDDGHAAHGMAVWPPVAPMNAHELRGALAARFALWGAVSAAASAMAALPIGEGDLLLFASAGIALQLGRMDLAVDAGHGGAGHPAGIVIGSRAALSF